jgi:hypothetical protein
MNDTIRWFIGTSANGEDLEAEIVAEFSARKHCTMPLDITFMRQAAKGPWAGWVSNIRGRTPFSSFRFGVPAACVFSGRALYTDVDYIICADLAELWRQDIPGVMLLQSPKGKLRTSTLLFDCAKAKGVVPDFDVLKKMKDANDQMTVFFRNHREHMSAFEGDWNCIDGGSYASLHDPRIKALHFSRMSSQPHLKHAAKRLAAEGRKHWYAGETHPHPHPDMQPLFDGLLAEARAAGYGPDRYKVDAFSGAVRRDFVYASENKR